MKKEIVGLKLKNEKSLVGQINIAKALLANNPNQLLTVCEKEVNNLSPEEFPFSIIAGAKEKATPLQINRWKKIGQKLVAKMCIRDSTYPGATVPFGAVQLSPDTRKNDWDACAGYHYSDSLISGFSHTHLSGTGCIDFGDILVYPASRTLDPEQGGNWLSPLPFSRCV